MSTTLMSLVQEDVHEQLENACYDPCESEKAEYHAVFGVSFAMNDFVSLKEDEVFVSGIIEKIERQIRELIKQNKIEIEQLNVQVTYYNWDKVYNSKSRHVYVDSNNKEKSVCMFACAVNSQSMEDQETIIEIAPIIFSNCIFVESLPSKREFDGYECIACGRTVTVIDDIGRCFHCGNGYSAGDGIVWYDDSPILRDSNLGKLVTCEEELDDCIECVGCGRAFTNVTGRDWWQCDDCAYESADAQREAEHNSAANDLSCPFPWEYCFYGEWPDD